MATTFIKTDDVHRAWHVVDAEGQVLGRLASRIAVVLTGKDKPEYAPFLDTGDHIIVINALRNLFQHDVVPNVVEGNYDTLPTSKSSRRG